MEETLIVLAVLLFLAIWLAGNILGLIAIIKMGGLRRRLEKMEKELALALRGGLAPSAAGGVPVAAVPVRAERRAREQAAEYRLQQEEKEPAREEEAGADLPADGEEAAHAHEHAHAHGFSGEDEGEAAEAEAEAEGAVPEVSGGDEGEAERVRERVRVREDVEEESVPPLAASEAVADEAPEAPKTSLEEKIALVWLTRIGAGLLVLGAAWGFKLAVENEWIGPWGRVAIGMGIGAGLLAFAEWMKPRLHLAYFTGLLGVGLSLLYVATFAAYGFYGLLPMPLTFLALVVVALLAGALALRHRSQLILVMGLLAALANPILLSTGKDRPLELFAYLLLVTAGVLWVAHRLRSIVGVWLPKAGVVVIGIGWYAKFFDVTAPWADALSGNLIDDSAGAYFALSARAVPLTAVVLFSALWVYSGLRARASEWSKVSPNGVLAFVLAFAPVAFGALLHDSPVVLALAMITCAVAAGLLLRDEQQTPLLALPLLLSFLVLLVGSEPAREAPVPSLIAVAAWLSIYAALFLRNGLPRGKEQSSLLSAGLLATTLVLGVILASVWLIPDHVELLALTMLLLSAGFAALGMLTDKPWIAALGVVLTILALAVVAPQGRYDEAGELLDRNLVFLLLAGLWGLTYLGVAARRLLREGSETPIALTLAGLGGPVGFVGVVLIHVGFEASGFSALCSAGAGLALFAVGVLALQRHPSARTPVTVLLGGGLSLLTLAVGLAFAGVTLTLSWTIMAAATAVIAAREGRAAWMWAAVGLFALVLMRVLTIDLWVIEQARDAYLWSKGAEGALHATPFWNARALALFGVAAAFLVSGRFLDRAADLKGAQIVAAVFGTLAYLLLLTLFVIDVRELVTTYPELGLSVGSATEFQDFWGEYHQALASQENLRAMAVTLTFGVFGAAVLTLGFSLRSVLARWLGLVTLGVTLAKLGLWDIWSLPRLYQVVILVSVGFLLLGAGFLYARFGKRLVGYFKVGAAALLLGLLLPGAARAQAQGERLDPRPYLHRATVEVAAPGLQALAATPELYRASERGPELPDLRLADAAGRELPWVLRDRPQGRPSNELQLEVLDPVQLPDGSSRVTFDLGEGELRHNELHLEIAGDDFLRRARIEVSDDREAWATLGGGVVVRSAHGTHRVDRTELGYPRSASRYLRVTVFAPFGQPYLPIQGGTVRFRPQEALPPTRRLPLPIAETGRAANGHDESWVRLDLGEAGWPIQALHLEITDPAFERRVRVEASDTGQRWYPLGSGLVYRAGGRDGRDEHLTLRVRTHARHLRLIFTDGDDPPLTVTGVEGEARVREIVFRAREAGPVHLYLGHVEARAPSYDLSAVLARQGLQALPELEAGPLLANPEHRPDEAAPGPWSERWRVPLGIGIGLLLLGLGAWAVRMLRDP
ncbi:MAG: DUF2339 domain-containing protein [Deltaproteobacteria bacterium]|nr:DUF2339 domain-containing protein [Deltaproteobacteria bacterium]